MSINSRTVFIASICTTGALLILLPITLGIAFSCFGGRCSHASNQIRDGIFLANLVAVVIAALVTYITLFFFLRRQNKPIWPAILIGVAVVALGVYYYQLKPYLQNRRSRAAFQATIYKPTYVPHGYKFSYTMYDDYATTTGRAVKTAYQQVAGIDGNGDKYYRYIYVVQHDAEDQWDVSSRCKSGEQCEHIKGKNGADIYCLSQNNWRCATRLGNTYISISLGGTDDITQQESVNILGSLQPE